MSSPRPRFHLAFPVDDLAAARRFYGEVLGCPEGRSAPHWVDFDLYGHQVVAHYSPTHRDVRRAGQRSESPSSAGGGRSGSAGRPELASNTVDGDEVPVPHFGVLLEPQQWRELADRLVAAGTEFVVAPHTRFAGQPGEQSTLFVLDPAGNALEFKAFADDAMVFAKDGDYSH